MAVLSFHCKNFKKGALKGLDEHNRRLHKHHVSNPDIKPELSHQNRIYKAPKQSLYKDCKHLIQKKVIAHGNKVRMDSNYICECLFTYPQDLPLERLDEYNNLVIKYMSARLGEENLIEAVCHVDEAGQPHLHLDFVLITSDFRLSSKTLITRDFVRSIHDKLPLVLQNHGFDVQRGEHHPEHKSGRSATQYKKDMEQEKKDLNKQIDRLAEEYNKLVDFYNRLINQARELEDRNIRKAKEIIARHEQTR